VLGRSQGGFSTNFPPRAEGGGRPLAILLTAGQRHEAVVFEALLRQIHTLRKAGAERQTHADIDGDPAMALV
jgi:hypothetical protein